MFYHVLLLSISLRDNPPQHFGLSFLTCIWIKIYKLFSLQIAWFLRTLKKLPISCFQICFKGLKNKQTNKNYSVSGTSGIIISYPHWGSSREMGKEQSMPVSTVICNIVSLNVSCGYGSNCPEKTANNCSNKMEHIRTSAGCPKASLSAWFYTSSNNAIPQGTEPSFEKPPNSHCIFNEVTHQAPENRRCSECIISSVRRVIYTSILSNFLWFILLQ